MSLDLSEKDFEETVKEGIVLIDFWAEWCGPCKAFAPTFAAAAFKHPDIKFRKVNTEVERGLSEAFGIRSIPTLMIFRDNILLGAQPGALSEAQLDEFIEQIMAIDMDEVRAKIAEADAKEGEGKEAGA